MGKIKKPKISKIKRNNQTKTKLSKQGKLKTKRHKPPKKQPKKLAPPHLETVEEESDHGEDLMNMVEEDDLNFLQKAITDKSYNLLRQIRLTETDNDQNKKKRKKNEDDQPLEELYENNVSKILKETSGKSVRMLLPIKTQDGSIEKRIIEEEDNKINNEKETATCDDNQEENKENDQQENSDMEIGVETYDNLEKTDKPVSTIDLLACREEILKLKRLKIGTLSSDILGNPELNCGNFKILLDMMDEKDSEVYITVRKLVIMSLLEVFKDLLPSYSILQISQEGVKLKKETLALQNYEATLLRCYKNYLQKLEKMSNVLLRKKGDTRPENEPEIQLGEVAVSCLCELLIAHPYFNLSLNISRYIIPFLNNKRSSVRKKVEQCISQIFKEDKRCELTLTIVNELNKHIKRKRSIFPEIVKVLLSLRIKDVNLDQEKEEELKQKKLMSRKQRILALSRQEKKKSKKLKEVEKEMLETKAEENKQKKVKILTDITNVLFTIYFRILKETPNIKVLSVCLEGLAKFAHCININFYQDLITTIDRLIEQDHLGLKEQLHCIQCIFTMLSGQGAALNIDPYRFYVHFYKRILKIHCGRTHPESEIVAKIYRQIVIDQRNRITKARALAFVKRIGVWALQSQHNATIEILNAVKQTMSQGKTAHVLFDTDCTGEGQYKDEIEEPDHCNAHCTALYELTALQRHYHCRVREYVGYIKDAVFKDNKLNLPHEIAGIIPGQFYTEYDPAGVVFNPAIPVPKKITAKRTSVDYKMTSKEFEEYLNNINMDDLFCGEHVDFYKEFCKSDNKSNI